MVAGRSRGRVLLGRLAVVAWIMIGVLVVALAPEAPPPSPRMAEVLYGNAPTVQSSAGEGSLAFAELLRRLGYEVRDHLAYGAPDSDLHITLEPRDSLSPEEADALLEWVRRGGKMIYAPAWARVEVSEGDDAPGLWEDFLGDEDAEPQADPDAETLEFPIEDPLVERLDVEGVGEPRGAALVYRVGAGTVVLIPEGSGPLSNQRLQTAGLSPELVWLRPLLEGVRAVTFDEGRLGFAQTEGGAEILFGSRFGDAVRLGLLALVLWLVATGVRRTPPRPDPPAGKRDFGEHLDSVGRLLMDQGRHALAVRALVDGTRRRLGPLRELPHARAVLKSARLRIKVGGPQTRAVARQLQELEEELGLTRPGSPEQMRAHGS